MFQAHPALVHFPIALFITAGLLGLIGLFYRRGVFKELVLWNIIVGLLCSVAAIYTGLEEEKYITSADNVQELLDTHKRNAFILVGFFISIGLWLGIRKRHMKLFEYSVWLLFLILGGFSTIYQASLGHKMVFKQGAGVQALRHLKESPINEDTDSTFRHDEGTIDEF